MGVVSPLPVRNTPLSRRCGAFGAAFDRDRLEPVGGVSTACADCVHLGTLGGQIIHERIDQVIIEGHVAFADDQHCDTSQAAVAI